MAVSSFKTKPKRMVNVLIYYRVIKGILITVTYLRQSKKSLPTSLLIPKHNNLFLSVDELWKCVNRRSSIMLRRKTSFRSVCALQFDSRHSTLGRLQSFRITNEVLLTSVRNVAQLLPKPLVLHASATELTFRLNGCKIMRDQWAIRPTSR